MARRDRIVVGDIHARVVRPGILSDPRPYWRATVYRDGSEVAVWTGRATPDEVKRTLAELTQRGDLSRRPERGPVVTVRDLLERWVGSLRTDDGLAETDGTFVAYRERARAITRTIGDVMLDRVTAGTVQEHASRRAVRRSTLGNEMFVLATAWRWGFGLGLVKVPEAPIAKSGRKRRGRRGAAGSVVVPDDRRPKHTPSPADVAVVLNKLTGWARVVGVVLAATGMRVGEVANLRWSDVDLDRAMIHVRDAAGAKTGARSFPIGADLVAELRAWRDAPRVRVRGPRPTGEPDSLFGVARKTVAMDWRREKLAVACKAAGVPVFTPHGLRRFVIDNHARRGVDVMVSARMVGNSPEIQWRNYRTVTEDDMRAALEQANQRIPTEGKVVAFPKRGRRS